MQISSQKDTLLKNLVKWALWKDKWLKFGTLEVENINMDNRHEEDKPPSLQDSKRNRSSTRNSRIGFSDLYWIPIWRGGNLPGMGIHGDIGDNSLCKHEIMDLGA